MDMLFLLFENTLLDGQDSGGATFLHAAVKSGLVPVVQYLLEKCPQLAQLPNTVGEFAADMAIDEFDALTEYQYGVHKSYAEYTAEMQRDTSEKILKIYQKHKIPLQASNFPALLNDDKWVSILSKMRLEKALEENEFVQTVKRKM